MRQKEIFSRLRPTTILRCAFCILSFLLFVILFSACGRNKDVTGKTSGKDSVAFYELPSPAKLNAVEKGRINREAQSWWDSTINQQNFNGQLLVAKGGSIIFEKYQGSLGMPANTEVNSHTAFHIASVSKTFTAMTVLHLAEQGKLKLDAQFSEYFPAFNYPGVTIKTLLSHRSGLPNYLYFMNDLWQDKTKAVTNEDVLQYLISKKTLLPAQPLPDTKFSYCNTNFVLLAMLIEKVTGESYADYLSQNIFKPLGMVDSYVYVPADSNRSILSYTGRGEPIGQEYLDDTYGDKNIYSTVRDLLKWDQLLKTDDYINQHSRELAYAPYSNEKPGVKNYGYGWRMNIFDDGKKMIFHNGWWHGNTAAFIRLLDEDATIICLNNKMNRVTYKTKFLANIFYPYYPGAVEDEE